MFVRLDVVVFLPLFIALRRVYTILTLYLRFATAVSVCFPAPISRVVPFSLVY